MRFYAISHSKDRLGFFFLICLNTKEIETRFVWETFSGLQKHSVDRENGTND